MTVVHNALLLGLCGVMVLAGMSPRAQSDPEPQPAESQDEQPGQPAGQPVAESPDQAQAEPPAEPPAEPASDISPEASEQPDDATETSDSTSDPEPDAASEEAVDPLGGLSPDPNEELQTVIFFRDGGRLDGFLVSRDQDRIVLRVSGIATPFGMETIERVESLPPLLERYRSLRRAIRDDDIGQLILVSKWLMAHGKYEWAVRELERIVARDPGNQDALSQLTLAREQAALHAKSRGQGAPGAGPAGGVPPTSPAAGSRPRAVRTPFPVLTPEQINLIRVYEIDLKNPPRLSIPRELIDQIIERYADNPLVPRLREGRESLYRQKPIEIVELLFKLRARELYPMVRVLENPAAIKAFRDDVHQGWLMNACSSTACHGGTAAGRLQFATTRPGSDATIYTNLLILERFRMQDGQPLIRYDDPAASPLLQMALPRERSAYPHPRTKGGRSPRASLDDPQDPRFVATTRWITSMYTPRPDYPVAYEPPQPLLPPQSTPPEERQPR